MTRPKRLYKSDKGYYYLEKGKKVFVKVPKGATDKQISKVNIRNIYIGETAPKRIKRRKRKKQLTYGKKVFTGMNRLDLGGISYFVPERQIKEMPDQIASNVKAKKAIEDTKDITVKKLTDIIDNITRKSKRPVPAIEEKKGEEPVEVVSPQTFVNIAEQGKQVIGETGFRVILGTSSPSLPVSPVSAFTDVPRGRLLKPIIKEDSKEDTRERLFKGKFLKKGESGFMPSLRNPNPEKSIAPSFSATTRGKEEVAGIPKSEAEMSRDEARRLVGNMGFVQKQNVIMQNTTQAKSRGNGDIENGLYSDEVETIARKRLKYYVPVIANDETDELMKYVKRGDKEFAFIVNTDDSDEGGRHWRCVYIDNRDDYPTVEWYDPLTETPIPSHIATSCKKICMKMNPEVLFKFKSNAIRQQSKTSSRCGIHCVRFLEERHEGVSFPDATGYTQFIEEMKKGSGDIDGSNHGEKEVSKKIPTYSSYI